MSAFFDEVDKSSDGDEDKYFDQDHQANSNLSEYTDLTGTVTKTLDSDDLEENTEEVKIDIKGTTRNTEDDNLL